MSLVIPCWHAVGSMGVWYATPLIDEELLRTSAYDLPVALKVNVCQVFIARIRTCGHLAVIWAMSVELHILSFEWRYVCSV